jgi:hypothetical protein
MKRIIVLIIIIVVVIILGKKAATYVTKYRHAKRLKIRVDDFDFPELDLKSLFSDIQAAVVLGIGNFSSSTFNVEQINVDVFSSTGQLIAEQKSPLTKGINILPNKDNQLALTFLISSNSIKQLIKNAGGTLNVGARKFTTGKYGFPLRLKGFVVAEGFPIDINETIEV